MAVQRFIASIDAGSSSTRGAIEYEDQIHTLAGWTRNVNHNFNGLLIEATEMPNLVIVEEEGYDIGYTHGNEDDSKVGEILRNFWGTRLHQARSRTPSRNMDMTVLVWLYFFTNTFVKS